MPACEMQLEVGRARSSTRSVPHVALNARSIPLVASSLVGVLAFFVYLTTLAPTVMWYDMGEFATTSATLGIAHNTGYPLLILVGKAFTFLPVGDAAYRVNLMSAVFTALAISVVFGIIHDLTDDLLASAVGALTLAFASTVWANATWATSYGMNLFFTALVTRLMLSWWRERTPTTLVAAALAFGLGMCNHRLIVLVAPPSALLLLLGFRSITWRTAGFAIAAFVLGLSVYLYLPIRGAQEPALSWARPANWHTYWSMFLNGQTLAAYWRLDVADRIDVLWAYPSFDLTWFGLALAGIGFAVCAKRSSALAAYFGLLVLLDAVVVETYSIHNIYNYLTPGDLALCVMIGVAVSTRTAIAQRLTTVSLARSLQVRPAVIGGLFLLLPLALMAMNHGRVDRSDDYAASDFAQTTLDRMPEGAVILTDTWTASPLWYAQFVERRRLDVIVSPIFSVPGADTSGFARREMDAGRRVYVADGLRMESQELSSAFKLQPVLLGSIEQMTTNVLPKPAYRDPLVSTGSLYRLRDDLPEVTEIVPAGAGRDVPFARGVTLVGFAASSPAVVRGDVVQLTYYWRAPVRPEHDLSAVTLFFDEHGRVQSVAGFPVWSQSRVIDQGLVQTSRWTAGVTYVETYSSLAPRTLAPGRYDVRIAVYDGEGDPSAARAAAQQLVSIGSIEVR